MNEVDSLPPFSIKKKQLPSFIYLLLTSVTLSFLRDPSDNIDAQKQRSKSRQLTDGHSVTRASSAAASPALSLLIVPSLKEVTVMS